MIQPWRQISSRPLGDFRVFSVREDRKVSPRTGREHDFFIIDAVQLGQRRRAHAGRADGLDRAIPARLQHGGTGNPRRHHRRRRTPRRRRRAAGNWRRKPAIEGEQPRIIGQVFPNPAIMSNTCYTVLVRNCRLVKPVQLDQGEDLATRLVPVEQVPRRWWRRGQIRHSLVVAALYQFDLWSRQQV